MSGFAQFRATELGLNRGSASTHANPHAPAVTTTTPTGTWAGVSSDTGRLPTTTVPMVSFAPSV